jgi:hypothetical protein
MAFAVRAQDVEILATENLPKGAQTVSINAGSFIYQIPTAVTEELGSFLEILEQESAKDDSCLKDCSHFIRASVFDCDREHGG